MLPITTQLSVQPIYSGNINKAHRDVETEERCTCTVNMVHLQRTSSRSNAVAAAA